MSKKSLLTKVGELSFGIPVVDGVFKLVDTHGIPLEIVLYELEQQGVVCSWPHFFESTIKAGWNPISTLVKIETGCTDVHGKEHAAEVMARIKLHIIEIT